jgi:phosphoribosylglycinamide formyltransferase-1
MKNYRIAVLLSGSGTNLQALIDARSTGALPAEIALVLSDRADAYGVQRALSNTIPVAFVPLHRPRHAPSRVAWELQLADLLNLFAPDLVLLSGFMRVLSARFLERCHAPVINQHPALLPDGGGDTVTINGISIPALRGAHVVADALRLGLPITGCSIHRATPIIDDGPILARAVVPILPGDDEAALHERIKAEERRLIVEVVAQLASEAIT